MESGQEDQAGLESGERAVISAFAGTVTTPVHNGFSARTVRLTPPCPTCNSFVGVQSETVSSAHDGSAITRTGAQEQADGAFQYGG
ncbi:hypothetical protein IMCC20628_02268 [Hoeflea sp. IMCC20628]|nr:hypothetical protein IMCC20628_02268 [Hoeflea sp. IMCC20628]